MSYDNPNNLQELDHINHNRADYHLSNLRWVSRIENMKNISSQNGIKYEFVDNIPDEAVVVDFYETRNNHHDFEFYYFFNDEFYYFNGIKYRKLHINTNKAGNQFVNVKDVNNCQVSIYFSKFKQQHDLL